MNNAIISLTSVAGHPAFFDPDKKLLAEALSNSTFRISKEEANRFVSMTVSAAARRACIETHESRPGVTSTGSFSMNDLEHHPARDVFEEGKELLKESGHELGESKEDKERLSTILRHALNQNRLQPGEVHPGDCAAILFEDEEEQHHFLTSFFVTRGASTGGQESLESNDEVRFVYKNWNNPGDEGIYQTHGSWSYVPGGGFSLRPVLMEPSDHTFLKELSDFSGGDAAPSKGKKILEDAMRIEMMKKWRSQPYDNRAEIALAMIKEKHLLGGVAV